MSIGQASKLLETAYHIHIHYICMCKVFKHLDMLWLTVRPVRWGADFWLWGFGVDLSLSDVVMSWLRLQQASDFRLDPTSILDVYKVFWKLDMV
jgi:hypothetical protein